jgi:hypothetical protein
MRLVGVESGDAGCMQRTANAGRELSRHSFEARLARLIKIVVHESLVGAG